MALSACCLSGFEWYTIFMRVIRSEAPTRVDLKGLSIMRNQLRPKQLKFQPDIKIIGERYTAKFMPTRWDLTEN